ncbi:MAG: hypothetical protein ACI9UK_002483 [Candidatus Krumholzibacteriia bacterium]
MQDLLRMPIFPAYEPRVFKVSALEKSIIAKCWPT